MPLPCVVFSCDRMFEHTAHLLFSCMVIPGSPRANHPRPLLLPSPQGWGQGSAVKLFAKGENGGKEIL